MVVTAAGGEEALRSLEQADVDVVSLLDLVMPGMDGREVLRRIQGAPGVAGDAGDRHLGAARTWTASSNASRPAPTTTCSNPFNPVLAAGADQGGHRAQALGTTGRSNATGSSWSANEKVYPGDLRPLPVRRNRDGHPGASLRASSWAATCAGSP